MISTSPTLFSLFAFIIFVSGCLPHERSALLRLKKGFSSFSKLESWHPNTNCCQWSGILCESGSGNIVGLDLNSQDISGFEGQVPIGISHLTNLVSLDLSSLYYNNEFVLSPSLEVRDPDLGALLQGLGNLRVLYLDGVNISASGEEWCGALARSTPKLQELSLMKCSLSGGIGFSLSKLRSLTVIHLSFNNLNSTVPDFFVNFTSLSVLRLRFCRLEGLFPKDIFRLKNLTILDFSYNPMLYVSLPDFTKDNVLESLELSDTNFSGFLPDTISNLKSLKGLGLSQCHFSGKIPSSIQNLTQLMYLDLSSNNFTGGMSEGGNSQGRRRGSRSSSTQNIDLGPAPAEVHPAIAGLRGSHRAAHPDEGTILEASCHFLMAREWQITCPRFLEAIRMVGLDCIRHLQYIKLDHHLITALAERWSPQTNTFHLPVGEMTITLQDVGMILGLCVDGLPLVSTNVVGLGKRWTCWPDCCDDLLGDHPRPDVTYYCPEDPQIHTTFRMGQAKAQTCMPLRWLRWTYSKESYALMDDITFVRHIRAYVLFILGCFLIPDTSGNEIHLQYLPLMEDLHIFSQYSLGAAVLGNLYRELKDATKPKRVNIAGCVHLLQVWSWEHLHVGRPTLLVPYPQDIDGKSVGYRWNERYVREVAASHVWTYRDEIDGLLQSQVTWEPYGNEILLRVADICTAGQDIWEARVPLINWRRIEWHLPDRVRRQFGGVQRIDMEPMEAGFQRVDGRGKGGIDWFDYHHRYVDIWNNRRAYVIMTDDSRVDREKAQTKYIRWYRSWATLYLLKAPTDPPRTYYPRSATERAMRDLFIEAEELFQPYFGVGPDDGRQQAINKMEDICGRMRRLTYLGGKSHVTESTSEVAGEVAGEETSTFGDVASSSYAHHSASAFVQEAPSRFTDPGPSRFAQPDPPHFLDPGRYSSSHTGQSMYSGPIASGYQQWPSFDMQWGAAAEGVPAYSPFTPSHPIDSSQSFQYGQYFHGSGASLFQQQQQSIREEVVPSEHEEVVPSDRDPQQHHLRERPLRGPSHYTPGSEAIPQRRRRRRQQ